MIKNEYTKKLSEIKAPQSAVEKAVKAALEADKNRKEVVAMPKKSNKIIKIVSAAAACAVVVTGVAVISNQNVPAPVIHDNSMISQTSVKNSFALMVNAAELNEENTVTISELNMSGLNNTGTEAVSIERIDMDDETYKLRAVWYPTINFPVVCRGSGIESVTYKINNALFVPNKNLQLVEEKSEKSIPLSEYYDGISWNSNDNTYKTLTVSYNEQLRADGVACIALKPSSSLNISNGDESAKRALAYFENLTSFDEFVDFRNEDKYSELREALFKAEIQDVTADITVNFTDGTDKTFTIAFIGKDYTGGSSMPVAIKFVSELSPEEKTVIKENS